MSISQLAGIALAILLILTLLVLGVLAWRHRRRDAAAQQAQDAELPDKAAQRPVWRPGDGNQ